MNTILKKLRAERDELIPVKRFVTKINKKGEKYDTVEYLNGKLEIGNKKYEINHGTLKRV